jgi:hypothetical protein
MSFRRQGATRYAHADPKAVSHMRKRILDVLGIKGAATHDLRRTVRGLWAERRAALGAWEERLRQIIGAPLIG